ncbi:molybdate/tungstate transport system permease protein [Sulfobacillus thermosulfidooxidans DSM 9293]|uniref:Molybdate/tungstate transport system permease protein n=1 Tax=Sulfobacillus thermosulfidooxidans (strain DSM 9293 / VKM B-1269 / AT-1) TaxID=929705 RepID=A0A1W1WN35_SULTA|nr:ABC transporter permease subunit [Sulfobacillus thermosulfidooxidans]SMC07440.1 molybdate/tungstate transport system permease protein [Sulfobacillus thermosulfidooxidans DSM 9293]
MLKKAAWGISMVVLVIAALPVGLLFLEGSRFFSSAIKSPGALSALFTTLTSGLIALGLCFVLGLPTAYWLRSQSSPVIKQVAAVLLVLALLMPPLVLGLVLAFIMAPTTLIGSWFNLVHSASNTFPALVLAEVYEALPYFILTAWSALSMIPRQWEEEAWSLHKTPWQTFRFVLWPASRPGLMTATAMAWARIVGAFGAPVVVAYHPTALPVQIWITIEESGLPQALALALWLVLIGLPLPAWLTWRKGGVI